MDDRASPQEAAGTFHEKRRTRRRMIEIGAWLKNAAGMRVPVTITNISEEGCAVALRAGHAPGVGEIYCLKIGDLETQASCTVWSSSCEAGLHFLTPLAPYVVDHIVSGAHRPKASAIRPRSPRLPDFDEQFR